MARKYGKKNQVQVDPLAFKMALLGEPKVGKTSLIKDVCKKLVGDEGYIFLECKREGGHRAIQGIVYEEIPTWDSFIDVTSHIIDTRFTEYKELKVIVIDTYDQLLELAEKEAIRLWNKKHPDKRASTINEAWGWKSGDVILNLVFDVLDELEAVGLRTIIIGHTKIKELTDAFTGETYQQLTSDVQQKQWNYLKKQVDIVGLAYIDRSIIKKKTGKKDSKGNAILTNKVSDESRMISFRDDNYTADSGGRFEKIVSKIPLNADAFIEAINNAIKAEIEKDGSSVEDFRLKQESEEAEKLKEMKRNSESKKKEKDLKEIISKVSTFIREAVEEKNPEKYAPIAQMIKEKGYESLEDIDNVDDALELFKLIK